eukprot:2636250-Pleurochrysis_carterae.AAC.1
MVACVSPSAAALDDTLSTLQFTARAKNIRNHARVNLQARRAAACLGLARGAASGGPSLRSPSQA